MTDLTDVLRACQPLIALAEQSPDLDDDAQVFVQLGDLRGLAAAVHACNQAGIEAGLRGPG